MSNPINFSGPGGSRPVGPNNNGGKKDAGQNADKPSNASVVNTGTGDGRVMSTTTAEILKNQALLSAQKDAAKRAAQAASQMDLSQAMGSMNSTTFAGLQALANAYGNTKNRTQSVLDEEFGKGKLSGDAKELLTAITTDSLINGGIA